jgi:phosphohistidine phosphatase SixA
MVTIYLIRHASRVFTTPDQDSSLSDKGKSDCLEIKSFLSSAGIQTKLVLTSLFNHALETASIISCDWQTKTLQLGALTPNNEKWMLEDIIKECNAKDNRIMDEEKVMIIGHEGRLSKLLTQLTTERYRPLQKLEIVAVQADNWNLLRLGKGVIVFRYPVYNFQEEALRSKVQSKMQVATFLAGFTFTTLSMLALSKDFTSEWLVLGTCFLVLSLFLFICAIYIYDRLSMPCGFWLEEERETRKSFHTKTFTQNLEQHGPLYAYMIRTWNIFFTPAVIASMAGFLICLFAGNNFAVGLATVSLLLFGVIYFYYSMMKPKLGID